MLAKSIYQQQVIKYSLELYFYLYILYIKFIFGEQIQS